jgi:hypothetical protein
MLHCLLKTTASRNGELVSSNDEESIDATDASSPTVPRLVTANPRKFSHYVLVPGHESGKDAIFLGRFGYRPHNQEDARSLAALYVAQAQAKLAAGDYTTREDDEFGRRYVIEIELHDTVIRSAWLLRPNGALDLITPFSGFARRRR